MVCLHGLGGTCLSFLELGELLKDNYHVISIDLPGHGRTPAFEHDEEYAIPNLLIWLNDVIKFMEKDSFYLMAHSWGGCIALHFAGQYPEKVKKLLLLDGGYHMKQIQYDYFTKIDKEKLNFTPSCSLEEEIAEYEKDFDGYVFSNSDEFLAVEKNNYERWSELLEIAVKDLMKAEDGTIRFCASGNTARGAIKSMYAYPTDVLYKNLEVPTLLFQATLPESWGEIRTIQVEKFRKETNGEVRVLEGTTHMIHWDNPTLIAEYVMEWMK